MSVEVGQSAPDFILKDQNHEEVTLSSFRGAKNVVLLFYPLAFSGNCQGELCAIRDELPSFVNDDTVTLAVSVDSAFAHKAWVLQQGYDFPLLSDFWPHGAVAQAYGVFNAEKGVAMRATFIIDKTGVVRWSVVHPGGEVRDSAEYVKVLASI